MIGMLTSVRLDSSGPLPWAAGWHERARHPGQPRECVGQHEERGERVAFERGRDYVHRCLRMVMACFARRDGTYLLPRASASMLRMAATVRCSSARHRLGGYGQPNSHPQHPDSACWNGCSTSIRTRSRLIPHTPERDTERSQMEQEFLAKLPAATSSVAMAYSHSCGYRPARFRCNLLLY